MIEGAECIETYAAAQDLIDSLKAGNALRDKRIANLTNEVNNEKDKVNVKDVLNSSLQEQLSTCNSDKIAAQEEAQSEKNKKKGWRTGALVTGGIILAEIIILAVTVL